MKAWINRITANWNVVAALLGLWAFFAYLVARVLHSVPFWALFILLVATVIGLLFRLALARSMAILILILAALNKVVSLFTNGFTWRQALYATGIAALAYYFWKEPDNGLLDDWGGGEKNDKQDGKEEAEGSDEPMISLVHLRQQPRYLEAAVLANALSEAWGLEIFGGDGEPSEDGAGVVAGNSPFFMVIVRKPSFCIFSVHNHDRNYFDEPEEVAKGVTNRRFAEVIREHSSWLSVDLVRIEDSSVAQDEAYRMIGKAVSALADDDVMAIVCPQHNFFNLWTTELEEVLCGEWPLDAMKREVKAPVYGVPDGDAIEDAIQQARERWPEFVAAFKIREPGDERYLVKARFVGEDDEAEHMWVQVIGLEPEYVHGHLCNDPMHTKKLKQGSQVELPVADVSDWVCPDAEGNPLGNFTHQAVMNAAKAPAKV